MHLERETRAREQHRHKQIHHATAKADVHVVETNRHAAMRRRGGKSKSRMNRSLAEAGPARTVELLREQCERHGKTVIDAPAPYNSRTCAACGSRETKLTRARIACAELRTHRRPRRERRGECPSLGTIDRGRAGPERLQPGGLSPARVTPRPAVPGAAGKPWAPVGPCEAGAMQAPGSRPKRRRTSTRILSSC